MILFDSWENSILDPSENLLVNQVIRRVELIAALSACHKSLQGFLRVRIVVYLAVGCRAHSENEDLNQSRK